MASDIVPVGVTTASIADGRVLPVIPFAVDADEVTRMLVGRQIEAVAFGRTLCDVELRLDDGTLVGAKLAYVLEA